MMRLARSLIALALALVLWGCAPTQAPGGGVGIGNGGSTAYTSPHFFTVQYSRELDLKVISNEEFYLSNERRPPGTPLSWARFRVIQAATGATIKTKAELAALVLARHPGAKFEEKSYRFATGAFINIVESPRARRIVMYVLTPGHVLIHVEAEMHREAGGMELLTPVLESFSFDARGPEFKAVKVSRARVANGEKFTLDVHIVDDWSGVNTKLGMMAFFRPSFELPRTVRRLNMGIRSRPNSFHGYQIPESLGNDWYRLSFEVPLNAPSGLYTLAFVGAYDNATNLTYLIENGPGGRTWDVTTGPPAKAYADGSPVPVLTIDVYHPTGTPDVVRPVLHEVRVRGDGEAGKPFWVEVKATDDESGIGIIDVNFTKSSITKEAGNVPGFGTPNRYMPTPQKPESLGGIWYRIPVTPPLYAPSDTFRVSSVTLLDKSGNEALYVTRLDVDPKAGLTELEDWYPTRGRAVPNILFKVVNNGAVDEQPPILKGVSAETPKVRRGEKVRIRLQVTDAVSGVANVGAVLKLKTGATSFRSIQVGTHVGGKVAALEDGWYELEATVPTFEPAGRYWIDTITMTDKAGNTSFADLKDGSYEYWVARVFPYKFTQLRVEPAWVEVEP